jgi:hypothetical protein
VSFSSVGCYASEPQFYFPPVSQNIFLPLVIVSHPNRLTEALLNWCRRLSYALSSTVSALLIRGYLHDIFIRVFCSHRILWVICFAFTVPLFSNSACIRYHRQRVGIDPHCLGLSNNWNPLSGSQRKSTAGFPPSPWGYDSTYTTFTLADSLIGIWILSDGLFRSGGRFYLFGDVLGSLSQEDRDRKVSSSFV